MLIDECPISFLPWLFFIESGRGKWIIFGWEKTGFMRPGFEDFPTSQELLEPFRLKVSDAAM